jgi:adenine deaminase
LVQRLQEAGHTAGREGGREMNLYRKYFDEEKEEKITLEEAIEKLEKGGYYKKGTVKNLLEDGQTLRTMSATYRNKFESSK